MQMEERFIRIVDRKFDALNPRTQSRHLPAGTLSGLLGIGTGAHGDR